MDEKQVPKAVRHLQRAEGYLELELPDRALAELDQIEEQGPFGGAIALLKGEALTVQGHFLEAAQALKQAAATIPGPHNKRAWRSLSECYRRSGRPELAEIADLVVNTQVAEPQSVNMAVVPFPWLVEALKIVMRQSAETDDPDQQAPPDSPPDPSAN